MKQFILVLLLAPVLAFGATPFAVTVDKNGNIITSNLPASGVINFATDKITYNGAKLFDYGADDGFTFIPYWNTAPVTHIWDKLDLSNDPTLAGDSATALVTEHAVAGAIAASGGAPTGATYITKTANGTLSAEFALGSLATGLLKNTTTTGVPTIAVAGTDYVVPGGASLNLDARSPVLTGSGTANAIVLTPSPAASSYSDGDIYYFTPSITNTGATTVNVSSLGTKQIKKINEALVDSNLAAGDLVAGTTYTINYNSSGGFFRTTVALDTTKGILLQGDARIAKYSLDTLPLIFEINGVTPTSGEMFRFTSTDNDAIPLDIFYDRVLVNVASLSVVSPGGTGVSISDSGSEITLASDYVMNLTVGGNGLHIPASGAITSDNGFTGNDTAYDATSWNANTGVPTKNAIRDKFESLVTGLTIGTTAITSGTTGRVLYDNAGTLGEMTTTGSGTVLALATSPTLVSPALGTPTALVGTNITGTAAAFNINGTVGATTPAAGTFTTGVFGSTTSLLLGTAGSAVGNIGFRNATSGTATLAPPTGALGTYSVTLPNAASTLPIYGQQITYSGPTAARTVTYPDAAFTVARTDAAQTFTGVQSMTSPAVTTSITTPSTTFSIADTTATTLNIGSAATTIQVGSTTATSLKTNLLYMAGSIVFQVAGIDTYVNSYSSGPLHLRDNASVDYMTLTKGTSVAVAFPFVLKGYTVSTLPSTAGTGKVVGAMAYVTDATAPTYNGALTGGGSVTVPVFYDGTAWLSH